MAESTTDAPSPAASPSIASGTDWIDRFGIEIANLDGDLMQTYQGQPITDDDTQSHNDNAAFLQDNPPEGLGQDGIDSVDDFERQYGMVMSQAENENPKEALQHLLALLPLADSTLDKLSDSLGSLSDDSRSAYRIAINADRDQVRGDEAGKYKDPLSM